MDEQTDQEAPPCTPEKIHKIPKDDSFKTCKATMPTPNTRRQLRETPVRASILSGGQPYKEFGSSGRKHTRRKANLGWKHNIVREAGGDQLNESADSNETFVRHERDLLYDPDSLDLDVSSHPRRKPLDLQDGIDRPDISHLSLSTKKLSPITKLQQPQEQIVEEMPAEKHDKAQQEQLKQEQQSTRRISRQMQAAKPAQMPTSTPMPFAAPKSRPKPMPKPNPIYFTRYMSSTAKKPLQSKGQQSQQQAQSIFKKPSSIISNFSVASTRRCLSQWNTPRLTRTQSFKSTAELEREYFSSLRSKS